MVDVVLEISKDAVECGGKADQDACYNTPMCTWNPEHNVCISDIANVCGSNDPQPGCTDRNKLIVHALKIPAAKAYIRDILQTYARTCTSKWCGQKEWAHILGVPVESVTPDIRQSACLLVNAQTQLPGDSYLKCTATTDYECDKYATPAACQAVPNMACFWDVGRKTCAKASAAYVGTKKECQGYLKKWSSTLRTPNPQQVCSPVRPLHDNCTCKDQELCAATAGCTWTGARCALDEMADVVIGRAARGDSLPSVSSTLI